MNQLVLRSFYQETQNSLGLHYCHYGCGKLATYKTVKRNHYLCSKNAKACLSLRNKISHGVKKCGFILTVEQRLKISKALTGRVISLETRRKLSEANLGSKNKMFGKHLSEETKTKISKALSGSNNPLFGIPLSAEHRRKLSLAGMGFKRPEEVKRKISKSSRGKKLTKETKEKISRARCLAITNGIKSNFKGIKIYPLKNIKGESFKLRGSWEMNMGKFLNDKNILWVSGIRIPYYNKESPKNYLPDFYLPDFDKYIEVKGWFSEKDKVKMKLVQDQNNICILMAFKNEMDNLDEFLKKIVS